MSVISQLRYTVGEKNNKLQKYAVTSLTLYYRVCS